MSRLPRKLEQKFPFYVILFIFLLTLSSILVIENYIGAKWLYYITNGILLFYVYYTTILVKLARLALRNRISLAHKTSSFLMLCIFVVTWFLHIGLLFWGYGRINALLYKVSLVSFSLATLLPLILLIFKNANR